MGQWMSKIWYINQHLGAEKGVTMERRHRNIVSRNGPESKSAFEPYIKPIRLTSQLTSCHQIWQNQLFTQHPSLMCTATNPYKGRARSPRRHQVGGFYFLFRVRLLAWNSLRLSIRLSISTPNGIQFILKQLGNDLDSLASHPSRPSGAP